MYLGHLAVGFAAKRAAPRASLGALMGSAVLLDLLWPVMLLLGWERVRVDPGNTAFTPFDFESYPWSHSLLMVLLWSVAAGAAYGVATRYRRGAAVVGLCVLSHWILDLATHRPDLPLWPGSSPKAGLGLWNSVAGTMIVELGIFAVAVTLYVRSTRARDRTGGFALAGFVAFNGLVYLAGPFGPPPPGSGAVAWVGLAGLLLPLWAWWVDRHRDLR